MNYRHLGQSGLVVSEITYGNWITHGSQVEKETMSLYVGGARAIRRGECMFRSKACTKSLNQWFANGDARSMTSHEALAAASGTQASRGWRR